MTPSSPTLRPKTAIQALQPLHRGQVQGARCACANILDGCAARAAVWQVLCCHLHTPLRSHTGLSCRLHGTLSQPDPPGIGACRCTQWQHSMRAPSHQLWQHHVFSSAGTIVALRMMTRLTEA